VSDAPQHRLIFVEDDADLRRLVAGAMTRRGWIVAPFARAEEALADLERPSGDADVVLTDLVMPGLGGLGLCSRLREDRPEIPVVVVTGFGSLEAAVEAIRAGAWDFVTKPVDVDALGIVLARALAHRALRREVLRLRKEVGRSDPGELLGESEPMKTLRQLLARVATSEASVLICGETGSGKEVVAKTLHRWSARADRPFVALSCAAMPEALLESELFGHVKGAFTGAVDRRAGLFQQAAGGTLFLDEIGEMPLPLQAKLLRVLQERAVRPVGGDKEVAVDVRILSATHRDLEDAVAAGRFREDLWFRLNVIQVDLPPLRERGHDVLLLAQRFAAEFAARDGRAVTGFSPEAARRLLSWRWPGNVRELRNCMERAVALTAREEIGVEDLPPRVRDATPPQPAPSDLLAGGFLPLAEVERRYALQVLDAVGGRRGEAARLLGLDRKTLYRKLQAWEVGDELPPEGA
jgi:two-component system response regulator AtoC